MRYFERINSFVHNVCFHLYVSRDIYIVEGRILEPTGGYIGIGIICMGSVGVLVFFQRLQHRTQCMTTAVYDTSVDTYNIYTSVYWLLYVFLLVLDGRAKDMAMVVIPSVSPSITCIGHFMCAEMGNGHVLISISPYLRVILSNKD